MIKAEYFTAFRYTEASCPLSLRGIFENRGNRTVTMGSVKKAISTGKFVAA